MHAVERLANAIDILSGQGYCEVLILSSLPIRSKTVLCFSIVSFASWYCKTMSKDLLRFGIVLTGVFRNRSHCRTRTSQWAFASWAGGRNKISWRNRQEHDYLIERRDSLWAGRNEADNDKSGICPLSLLRRGLGPVAYQHQLPSPDPRRSLAIRLWRQFNRAIWSLEDAMMASNELLHCLQMRWLSPMSSFRVPIRDISCYQISCQ